VTPASSCAELRFGILGALEVERDGRRLALGGPRQRSLLALLLLQANAPVSQGQLITQLWGADASADAVNALQVQISRLRRRLGESLGDQSRRVLVTGPFGYLLRLEPGQLDAERFERLLRDGRRALAEGRPCRAAERLRHALTLWRGPALADLVDESFAQDEIRRLEDLRLQAQEARIEADLARGQHGAVIVELDRLVAQHPLRERPYGQLMLALYRCGRQADALAVYRRASDTLAAELGLAPSPALRRLEQAILQHDPSAQPPAGAGLEPQPLRGDREFRRSRRTRNSPSAYPAVPIRYVAGGVP
jgi:DNA-binding SARP family transcriptional activator